jgi:hypothetical protein
MPTYRAPVDEVMFLLRDVFHVERYNNLAGFAEATPDIVEAVLAEAAKFCEAVLTPLNRVGDREGCRRHADGSVTTPPGFKDAYRKLVAGGWVGASAPAEFGGQGLPTVLTQAVREFLYSSNMAFAMYSSLALGAVAAIYSHGTAEQKARYLPKLISGEWGGTMNLTEPQCGTDLGQLRCRAMAPYVTPLEKALGELREATLWFAQNAPGNPDNAGAGATDYMQLFGLVALGYMWCRIVDAAKVKTAGNGAAAGMDDKLVTARFFMERMLPATATHLARIKAGAESTMALPADAF